MTHLFNEVMGMLLSLNRSHIFEFEMMAEYLTLPYKFQVRQCPDLNLFPVQDFEVYKLFWSTAFQA
jgi:hypothetical protein